MIVEPPGSAHPQRISRQRGYDGVVTDKPDPAAPASAERALRAGLLGRARLAVAVLAAWLWALALGLPALEVGFGGWARGALSLAFPLCVGLGLALEASSLAAAGAPPLAARAAQALLLVIAPAALAGALASRSELTAREVLGPAHLGLLVLASGSYVAGVAWLDAARAERRTVRSQPLSPSSMASEAAWPRWLRRALLGAALLWSVGLVAVAPIWTGHAARVARHGIEGADTAALLATVVGLALTITVLGAILAPAMRVRTTAVVPSRWRGAVWVGLALTSVLAWWLIERA